MLEKIKATSTYIKNKSSLSPEIAIILGTGLGDLVKEIKIVNSIPYETIPNFPKTTVDGHSGRLIFGYLGKKEVVAMQGRLHFYEGYSMSEITFPVRVMKFSGIKTLIVSNASGGLNPEFKIGDIMIINDHINLFPEHPLRGLNDKKIGPRFPDMSQSYDKIIRDKIFKISKNLNIPVKEGVYLGISGPTFETPAEYKMYRSFGADAIGMSTVPEVIVARHMDIKVFGISIITDMGIPGQIVEVSHTDVQEAAKKAEPGMTLLLKKLIENL